jgi:opacity protein-like surface antigen
MRRVLGILVFLSAVPVAAFAQGNSSIVGFGGFSLNGFESHSPSLGGTVTYSVIPPVQIVGEVGRLGNVLPTTADTLFSLARTGVAVSAFYGEGGVRVMAPTGGIAPYAEATAGFARLDLTSDRLGTIGNVATGLALGFVGRTTPIASVGGGVLARGGPLVLDLGYRYKQLFADDVLQSVLGLGQPLHAHEVRAGLGVRF